MTKTPYGGGRGVREIVEREQIDARHTHRVRAQQRGGGRRVGAGQHEVRAPVKQQHPQRAVRRRRVRLRRAFRYGVQMAFRAQLRVGTRWQRIAARGER